MANDLHSKNVDWWTHYDNTNDDPTVVQTFPSGSGVGEESSTPSYHNEHRLDIKY